MYKLFNSPFSNEVVSIIRLSDNACIPFEPANTDYQQFKTDIANGVELQDADGNVITPEQVQEFMKGLT